jgi:translation initiation factor 3 subunit D
MSAFCSSSSQPQRVRDWSITIGPEWQMLEEITFARLQKLQLNVQEPEDLSIHGTIYSYDKIYDSVNTRSDKPLQIIDMVKYNTTTSDDPVIHSVSRETCLVCLESLAYPAPFENFPVG